MKLRKLFFVLGCLFLLLVIWSQKDNGKDSYFELKEINDDFSKDEVYKVDKKEAENTAKLIGNLYKTNNGNLDNMVDYANELIQDRAKLEQEKANLKYLIENQAFPDKEQQRTQLTTFYYLLIQLQESKSNVSPVTDGENFQVNQIEVVENERFCTVLNISYQCMSKTEFEKYYTKYVNPNNGTKKAEQKRYLDNTFTIKNFDEDIRASTQAEEYKEYQEHKKENRVSPYDKAVMGLTKKPVTPAYLEEKVKKDAKENTAEKFDMTSTIITNTTELFDTKSMTITPTQETQEILNRWEERAKVSKNVTFPKGENYIQSYESYMNQVENWTDADERYVFEGG